MMWPKLLPLLLSFCVFLPVHAGKSKPDWIDYAKRTRQYPKDVYLTGFVSEAVEKEQVSESNDKLISQAKLTLLQSIKVDLKVESALNLANLNRDGQTRSVEDFVQNSYAQAQATIVGIQVETFYDKKADINYAFAYAKISAVVKYYQQVSRSTRLEIEPYFESHEENKRQAKIKALQDLEQIRSRIETLTTAESILEALGKPTLTLDQTDTYRRRLNTALDNLLNNKDLNLNELAYFLAYGLSLQNIKDVKGLFIGDLTYGQTQLESPFTTSFAAALKTELLKFKYPLKSESASSHYLKPICEAEDGAVKFRIAVLDWNQKRVVAGNYNYLSAEWLDENQVEYIPPAVLKAEQLKELGFEHHFQTGKGAGGWFKVQNVVLKAKAAAQPVANLPLVLRRGDADISQSATTDKQGIANFKLKSETEKQTILASVDVPKFLDLPADHHFISTITAPQYNFYLNRETVKVYVLAEEKNLDEPLAVNFLEPQIKEILSAEGYEFSDEAESDLKIEIQANTRSGSAAYGINFSYVDATISVVSRASSSEIYKQKFKTIKGAGQTFEQAGMKAFEALAKKMKQQLTRAMKK